MPYKSAAQRGYMHVHHPGIASRWDQEIHEAKRRKRKKGTVAKNARYGNSGGVGRRITEDQLVEKKAFQNEDSPIYRGPGERRAVRRSKEWQAGAAGTVLGTGTSAWGASKLKPRLAYAGLGLSTAGLGAAIHGSHRSANNYRRSKGLAPRSALTGAPRKERASKALAPRLANILNRGARSGSLGSGIPNRGVAEPRLLSSVGRHRSTRTDATPAYMAQLRRNARQGTIGQGEYVGRRRKVTKGVFHQSVARPIARRAPTAVIAQRGITGGRLVARGGAGARKGNLGVAKAEVGKGRRWTAPAGASTIVRPLRKKTVGKARYFDPDERRERRSGIAIGALGLLGGAGLARGGQGALKTSRALRGAVKATDLKKNPRLAAAAKQGLLISRRDLAMLGGGTVGVGGAAELQRQSTSRRGNRWT